MKKDFPIFERIIEGKPLIYLDSAATTQKPNKVIDSIVHYYKNYNSNIHRGHYKLSFEATEKFDETRRKLAKLINSNEEEIIFTRNTTEGLNLLAYSLDLKEGDEILTTEMEHHSNLVTWQQIARRKNIIVKYIKVKDKELDLADLKNNLTEKTKIVALCHVSNVLGTINPIKEIRNIIGNRLLIVDGAQALGHLNVDVKDLDVDFYAFSGHKMFAPSGIGVLYGKKDLLEKMNPFLYGGDMISNVSLDKTEFAELPNKFEAGTPNIEGVIGLGAAVDYINEIGLDNMHKKEEELKEYALQELKKIPEVKIYSNEKGIGVISFNILIDNLVHGHDVSYLLSQDGICVRSGYLCAQPLIDNTIKQPGVVRASLHTYNEKEDIDELVKTLKKIIEGFK